MDILYPNVTRFDDLFFAWEWRIPGDAPRLKGARFVVTTNAKGNPGRGVNSGHHLWAVPRAFLFNDVPRMDERDTISYEVITQYGDEGPYVSLAERTGRTLVLATHSVILATDWLAYIDPATIPALDGSVPPPA